MTNEIVVERLEGDAFRVETRGHSVLTDQPGPDGAAGRGPTPTELFVMSLASCAAFYAARALGPGTERERVRVDCAWTMSETPPWRVASIDVRVQPPAGLAPARLAAVERAVGHCTVHNSLSQPPAVNVTVSTSAPHVRRHPVAA